MKRKICEQNYLIKTEINNSMTGHLINTHKVNENETMKFLTQLLNENKNCYDIDLHGKIRNYKKYDHVFPNNQADIDSISTFVFIYVQKMWVSNF